ncbi:MAG: hypothetical protein GWN61_21335 [candidate division Zixibacteria bacterium]|nr:hypothetical protein [Phycisphaerae bacterium]NIR66955.1 hypothetical protein [candidate division Zixibacteria bacterium]NIW48920.1 hypothetical protein [Gammaproteobacteria bacterium]NIS52572.1 hypothetical protein [Phycisphaerae bacterium]NIV08649.1 hypothetical protein [candidate division Zixibacteria bacterium]
MRHVKLFLMIVLLSVGLLRSASGWSNQDVGSPSSVAGGAIFDATTDTWSITADGNDIWGNSDNFHYVYKYLKGDGQITAQVKSITGPGTDGWAKAGVMIREDLSGESKHAMMVMTPDFGAAFQWRSITGGVTFNNNLVGLTVPYWVRIIRSGDTFTGYYSPDNMYWIKLGDPITIPMDENVYIGLVLTSHQEGVTRTAEFGSARVVSEGQAGIRYDDPPGGWLYTYSGNHAAAGSGDYTALDGTWDHNNVSDRWDGKIISGGHPGGVSELTEGGANFLRLQDTGNPVSHGMSEPSNRKIMFAHSITDDIGSWGDDILDNGITIFFRARISKTPPLDDLHPDGSGPITPWPAGGDGYVTHSGGKGNFSIRQSEGTDGKIISFTLALDSDHTFLAGRSGLAMNSTDGNTPSENVDIDESEGTLNLLELDPTTWHEFWITIGPRSGRGTGTHIVKVYRDGSTIMPETFYVTAGNGFDYPDSYIAMGVGSTPQSGAIDIDFFSYKPGIYPPVNNLNKWSQPPIEIDPNSEMPIYCGWDEPSYREMIDILWFDCWDCRTQCRGDADCDGYVGPKDSDIVLAAYQTNHPDPNYDPCADFDRNLTVDQFDVMIMQQNWENSPPADCNGRAQNWHFVADDFRCLGSMPVTSVRWWGSYVDWMDSNPPDVQPIAWRIGFWSNVPATCDWDSTDHKMHYAQLPKPDGWNMKTSPGLADSWQCTESGPVKNIRFWASWQNDHVFSGNFSFYVRIHSDIPAEHSPTGYSMPANDFLWQRLFLRSDLKFGDLQFDEQGWFDAYLGEFEPNNHELWQQIGITNISEPFMQEEGTFYWLVIDGLLPQLGWKESKSSQFNGAAVFDVSLSWRELRDPETQEPIELAFVINSEDCVEYSYPDVLLWDIEIPAERVKSEFVGVDQFPQRPPDTCFRYDLKLRPEEYFRQGEYLDDTNDNTFWISIVAIYPDSADVNYPWGWKTRPLSWMDNAVTFSLPAPPYPDLVMDPNFITPIENHAVCGYEQSYDVAFELGTDADYIKAAQPYTGLRNWPYYSFFPYPSTSTERPDGTLSLENAASADDWLCERRTPVTAAVWWGTYLEYGYEACTCPVEEEPNKPDYFMLIIWNNTPAGVDFSFCHPNEIIWQYKAYDYDEVMVGYDKHPICGVCDEPNRPVFRYSVRLPEESWFRQRDVNETYWFSVVAVYKEGHSKSHQWCWTNHERVSENGYVNLIDLISSNWGVRPEDMSFMLFTDPGECINCADYNSDNIVNFTDYADFSEDWNWTGRPGGYNNADLNCDGSVDFHDLDIFTLQWLSNCP